MASSRTAYRGGNRRGDARGQRRVGNLLATRCHHQATPKASGGKVNVDRATRRRRAAACDMLGDLMTAKRASGNGTPSLLDVVALLTDRPDHGLARGQVGTVVEQLDGGTWLVEFSNDLGVPYAVMGCPEADLLVLHYVPEIA